MSESLRTDLEFILDTLKIPKEDPVRETLKKAPTSALPSMFLEFSKALSEIAGGQDVLKSLKFRSGDSVIDYETALKEVAKQNFVKNNPEEKKRSTYVSAENGGIRLPPNRSQRPDKR